MSEALLVRHDKAVATLYLNRPELHNAFDAGLISTLTAALEAAAADPAVRAVVLAGHGPSFSAGADLQWMRAMAGASQEENRQDALALARLMRTLDELPKPTIARVHGASFGGGVGLVACCDIAIAAEGARFGLTESRLGLLPAVISPYVLAAIGPRQARRWFATGEHFDAADALRRPTSRCAFPNSSQPPAKRWHARILPCSGAASSNAACSGGAARVDSSA